MLIHPITRTSSETEEDGGGGEKKESSVQEKGEMQIVTLYYEYICIRLEQISYLYILQFSLLMLIFLVFLIVCKIDQMEKEVSAFIQDSSQQKQKYNPMGKLERSIL